MSRKKDERQIFIFPKFISQTAQSPFEEAEQELNYFWERDKTNQEKGELYERYVGYLYEEAGYSVDYYGIRKGLTDKGRDLVCRNGSRVLIIQCKNWNAKKIVRVNCIHQLRGTVDEYNRQYSNRIAQGVLFTASTLDADAKVASQRLNIEIREREFMRTRFPIIKCKKEKMSYYLPDSWHYREVRVDFHSGDFYCSTVLEAEQKGFRRAL